MNRVLVTGATGNIGVEVIRYLFQTKTKNEVVAGSRDTGKAKQILRRFEQLDFVEFDFENPDTFEKALENIDCVFLLRPPQISAVEKYFRPLIAKIREKGIKQILFLSVQGAEKSSVIPHNKIEKLIKEYGINYIFLWPSYFMQNLTTTLHHDIQQKRKIILPAGKAKFNWIDVENIGETVAILLNEFKNYKNQIIELTGYENKDFYEVTELINQTIDNKIAFEDINPFRFYFIKKRDSIPNGLIIVMIMLHFLPRFQKEPEISDFYEKLTGIQPMTLQDFIEREKQTFI